MLVCHCKGLSDRHVRAAVSSGADTRRKVVRACGAGSVCGGCRPVIDEILRDHHEESADAGLSLEFAPAR